MNTDYTTATPPTPSAGFIVAVTSLCTAAILCVAAVVGLAVTGHFGTSAAATTPAHTHTVVVPITPSHNVTPAPSAAVTILQDQLSQLHYYAAPIDGLMGPKTEAAISAVQKAANLPQTGKINSATQAALNYYLANDLPGSG